MSDKPKAYLRHSWYGCDTGCEGYALETDGGDRLAWTFNCCFSKEERAQLHADPIAWVRNAGWQFDDGKELADKYEIVLDEDETGWPR